MLLMPLSLVLDVKFLFGSSSVDCWAKEHQLEVARLRGTAWYINTLSVSSSFIAMYLGVRSKRGTCPQNCCALPLSLGSNSSLQPDSELLRL